MSLYATLLNMFLIGLVIISLAMGWIVPITKTYPPDFYVSINPWKDNNTIYMSVSFDCSSLNIPLSKENKWRCAHDSNMSEWRTLCFVFMLILSGIVLIVILLNLLALCLDTFRRFELFVIGYAVPGVLGTTVLILFPTKVSPLSEFTHIVSGYYFLLTSFLSMFALSGLSFTIDPYDYPGF
ncbi:uncharacterized protein LOC129922929 [Biomphalaria glabrata]|uniref:Uncharacterized protein LOC129922929 n=1 Tax=Biomphalaria glabrata TaxID=6526 RepID=A0A9W2YWK9_BIOGL|nr:uncharacterized protein LOC129922929 [Biomphalaria glabrata]XP_055867147.1 uncharacterized protein LOC129922929 [Biomphalaria glabrata]